MRTQRVLPFQLSVFRPSMIFLRASRFWLGATASSRSRKTWSAFDSEAFWIIFSLEPGVESWTRRGRRGGRSVMSFSSGNDLLGPEMRNFRATEAEFGQIAVRVLPQQGGAMAHTARRLGHLDRHARHPCRVVEAGMGYRDDHVAGGKMRIAEDVAHVVDWRERHLAAEVSEQLLLGALAGEGRHRRDDLVLVRAPVLDVGEPRVCAELGLADQPAQDRPMGVGVGRDGDEAVLGRKHAERAEQGMVIALGRRDRKSVV